VLPGTPAMFVIGEGLAAASAFMTPISPINASVATAGNYGFGDFVRFGLPLTLLTMGVSVPLVAWLLPLY
jgi:di/tricarboxylate transporter